MKILKHIFPTDIIPIIIYYTDIDYDIEDAIRNRNRWQRFVLSYRRMNIAATIEMKNVLFFNGYIDDKNEWKRIVTTILYNLRYKTKQNERITS